jgi:aspartyl protease family protein
VILARRLIWIFVAGSLVAFALLATFLDDRAWRYLASNDFASLATRGIFLVVVAAGLLVMFRENFSNAIKALVFWPAVAVLIVSGYTYRFELKTIVDRIAAEIVPGRAYTQGRVVEIARGNGGDFSIRTEVNGARVPMILDTGASAVVLTHDAAKAAGLPIEVLSYTVNVDTANGRTRAASVTLDRIGVGGVVERSVPALIAQPGQLKTSLLGMSFLNRLESWEVRGDRLVMRGYP